MKHKINDTYPDETHYTIAVLSDEEEDKLKKFLEENNSELVNDGCEGIGSVDSLEEIAGEGKKADKEDNQDSEDEFDYTHR